MPLVLTQARLDLTCTDGWLGSTERKSAIEDTLEYLLVDELEVDAVEIVTEVDMKVIFDKTVEDFFWCRGEDVVFIAVPVLDRVPDADINEWVTVVVLTILIEGNLDCSNEYAWVCHVLYLISS
jgi:hypothetical protein